MKTLIRLLLESDLGLHCLPRPIRNFLAILGRGPRAFQIGKISVVNHYIGKFSKQTITAFSVNLKTNELLHILLPLN